MYVSDFKSSPFDVFNGGNNGNPNYSGTPTALYNGYTGTGLNGIPDYSLDTLLGSKWSTASGQILTLVSNSANAQTSGKLLASPAELTAFEGLAITTPSTQPATEGTFAILVTNGVSVAPVNFFSGGQLIVVSGTGAGQTLSIASNEGAAASGSFVVTTADPIQISLDTSSVVSLFPNLYGNVIISPTTNSGIPVGVTVYPIPASVAPTFDSDGNLLTYGIPQYAFVVSHGTVGCLMDSTAPGVGEPLGASTATAGSLGIATLTDSPEIALSAQTQTSGQYGLVTVLL